jgi:Fe-S cluster assembly iron-binding protein IscA
MYTSPIIFTGRNLRIHSICSYLLVRNTKFYGTKQNDNGAICMEYRPMVASTSENRDIMQRLYISNRAYEKIGKLSKTEPTHALSILVQIGGCHGFQYHFSWENIPKSSTTGLKNTENPYLVKPDTLCYNLDTKDGGSIIIDTTTLELLDGATLDYSNEMIGAKFVIIDNPNADNGCGCGVSFGLKGATK